MHKELLIKSLYVQCVRVVEKLIKSHLDYDLLNILEKPSSWINGSHCDCERERETMSKQMDQFTLQGRCMYQVYVYKVVKRRHKQTSYY